MSQKRRYKGRSAISPAGKSGFTLIEIAVVLVILGLIVGTLTPMMVAMIKKDKLKEGRDLVKIARDEVIGHAMINKKLPASVNDIGHSRDPWQNDLFLITAPNLAGQDICSWVSAGNNETGLALLSCTDSTCASYTKKGNIAFIVGSKAENYNRQTDNGWVNRDGDQADNDVLVYDYGTQVDNYSDASDPNRGADNFDDILQFVTLNELIVVLGCSSSSSTPSSITVYNATGTTVCMGSTSIAPGQSIATLSSGQTVVVNSSFIGMCIGLGTQCNIAYASANPTDSDGDQEVNMTGFSTPDCSLADR